MSIKLVWSPRAREELLRIYLKISLNRPQAAQRLVDEVESKVNLLASSPRIGRRRPDVTSSARSLIHGNYIIIYELHPDTHVGPIDSVEVVSITDGRRSPQRFRSLR